MYVRAGHETGHLILANGESASDIGQPLGIAAASGMAGENISVIMQGLSDDHSGLTPGLIYYVNPDGDLTPNETPVRAGLAIDGSRLLLDFA